MKLKLPLFLFALYGSIFGLTVDALVEVKVKLAEAGGYTAALLDMPLESLQHVKVTEINL